MSGQVIELPGEKTFPHLYTLLGGTFHQDYDIHGHTLSEIIASFKTEETSEVCRSTRQDIERFLAERPHDKQLAAMAYARVGIAGKRAPRNPRDISLGSRLVAAYSPPPI